MRHSSLSPHSKNNAHIFSKRISLSQQKRQRTKSNASDHQAYQMLMKTSYIMSTIKKSIKQNDLKYLVGQKRVKLRTQPSQDLQWMQKTTHNALVDIRKRYDCVKRQRIVKLQQTDKLKERVKSIEVEQNIWKQKLQKGRSFFKTQKSFNKYDDLQLQYQSSDRDVFAHMRSRLKQDIDLYKARIIIEKRNLKQFRQQIRTLTTKQQKLTNQQKNSSNILNKLIYSLNQQNNQRSNHIATLQQMIRNKQLQQQAQMARIQYQQQQAEKALLAKDIEQINWQSLLQTHLFLKKFLTNKMQKQMEKFKVVELSFRKIISRTQVKDVNELTERFLNKEQIYGELLASVSKTKQQLNQLKCEQAKLIEQNSRLEQKNKQFLNIQYSLLIPKNYPKYSAQTIQKAKSISTTKIKLKQWLLRQLLKINRVGRKKYEFNANYYQQSISFLFKKYLTYLNDLLTRNQVYQNDEAIQKEVSQQSLINLETNLQNKSFISTHPKTKFQKTDRMQKIDLKNSKLFNWAAENQFHLAQKPQAKQLQDQNDKPEEQINMINLQRQQITHANQKFMKDLRIRYRQSKQKKL